VNRIAPNFSWFDSVRFDFKPDGTIRGTYKVDFKKVKAELIPDLLGSIPTEIDRFLPAKFTLSTESKGSVVENEIVVTEPFTKLSIGPIPLLPIIERVNGGPVDAEMRQEILDVVSRIYTMIPDLQIHSLAVVNGQVVFSGYVPTKITVTEK
jgi:hypothetical protein